MIPNTIHQIWIGPNKLPKRCEEYSKDMIEKNPNFEYMFWTNDNLPELPELAKIQFDRYGRMEKWSFQADVLKYHVVNTYGGIYADVDFECKHQFDDLLDCDMFVVSPNPNVHWICAGIFGSIPNHPILTDMLATMKNEIYHGPIFFSNSIKKYYNLPIGDNCDNEFFKESIKHDIRYHTFFDFFTKNGKYARHHALKSWHRGYIPE